MRARVLPAAAATAAVAAIATGCSAKNDNADLVAGKQLFIKKCASCHVLAHANSKGVTGPNLDEAFHEDVREDFGTDAIRSVVQKQILYPARAGHGGLTGVMPAKLVTGDKAADVAAYVSHVVSRPGKDTGLLATAVSTQSTKPAVEKNGVLEIPADPNGQLQYTFKSATATAGKVTIKMPNMSGTLHNIAIKGPVSGQGQKVTKGTSSFSADLKPGTYEFYCQVPGHEAAGMKGTLTVK